LIAEVLAANPKSVEEFAPARRSFHALVATDEGDQGQANPAGE